MLRNMTTIYIRNKNDLLMLFRVGSRVVSDSWCGIGGHFEESELNDPKGCVLRELFEETGIRQEQLRDIELRYVTLRLKNNEVRQNYYYFAELAVEELDISKCSEGVLKWVDINMLSSLEMPFTAKASLEHYIGIGQHKECLFAGIATPNVVNFVELKEF